jgi:hypothetical protein
MNKEHILLAIQSLIDDIHNANLLCDTLSDASYNKQKKDDYIIFLGMAKELKEILIKWGNTALGKTIVESELRTIAKDFEIYKGKPATYKSFDGSVK